MNSYDVNDRVTLTGTFRNSAGTLTNPTSVTLRYRKPDGTVTVVSQGSLTNSSTGIWTYDLTLDTHGMWAYRWEGTGTIVEVEEVPLRVRRRMVPAS